MVVLGDPGLTVGPVSAAPNGGDRRAATMVSAGQASLKDISKGCQAAERDAILKTLEETQWNRLRAAKLLNHELPVAAHKMRMPASTASDALPTTTLSAMDGTRDSDEEPKKGAGLDRIPGPLEPAQVARHPGLRPALRRRGQHDPRPAQPLPVDGDRAGGRQQVPEASCGPP
jgi:hypothetical protein